MIKQIDTMIYQCDSKSDPNSSHILSKDNNVWVCDCIGYRYRNTCRHMKELLEVLQDE